VSGGQQPRWERLAIWVVVVVIGLDSLASVLPRLVVPAIVGVGLFVVVRLAIYHTRW
jgi:hypothetical protein